MIKRAPFAVVDPTTGLHKQVFVADVHDKESGKYRGSVSSLSRLDKIKKRVHIDIILTAVECGESYPPEEKEPFQDNYYLIPGGVS